MTKNERDEIKLRLIKLQSTLQEDIAESKKSSHPVQLDQQSVGRVSRIDAIQQQQMQLASLQRLERRLKQVVTALKKVKDEDFGTCSLCEEPISMNRLRARPESPMCIDCAKKA